MSLRGVWQCVSLTLSYSRQGGSSAGVRNFVENGGLQKFAKANPQIMIYLNPKQHRHPYVNGEWVSGFKMSYPLLNMSNKEVEETMEKLRRMKGHRNYNMPRGDANHKVIPDPANPPEEKWHPLSQ
eukprot:TRINITY_DN3039_c0_g1_i2.p1 TRINITY_DN3039_c0_g1~~TRINITY_DN3039_c0_g1_i2.p1  ORF type:complete len:126 (-),score=11.66 TRINITY_DN3039_c0_g1_i2:268-645(-)